jgi:hypothetical protein
VLTGCVVVDHLDNGVGIDNEEQGIPVRVCRAPVDGWARTWSTFQHFD